MAEMTKRVSCGTPWLMVEEYSKGDYVKYVTKSGELLDGVIEGIIPMFVGGVQNFQFMFSNPRTESCRQYLFSDIRIERIITKNKNDDRLQDTKRFYYLLC